MPPPPLEQQLAEHLRAYHQRESQVDARFQRLDTKHTELHDYVSQTIEWQQALDRKTESNTRAIEGLAIITGKVLGKQEDTLLEIKLAKKALMKIAKRLGID